jgi:hypothetical protein
LLLLPPVSQPLTAFSRGRVSLVGFVNRMAAAAEDAALRSVVEQCIAWDPNEETRRLTRALLGSGDWAELKSRFGERISFGTAGLRSRMGAGIAHMNELTVLQATQVRGNTGGRGVCTYLWSCACAGDQCSSGESRHPRDLLPFPGSLCVLEGGYWRGCYEE